MGIVVHATHTRGDVNLLGRSRLAVPVSTGTALPRHRDRTFFTLQSSTTTFRVRSLRRRQPVSGFQKHRTFSISRSVVLAVRADACASSRPAITVSRPVSTDCVPLPESSCGLVRDLPSQFFRTDPTHRNRLRSVVSDQRSSLVISRRA